LLLRIHRRGVVSARDIGSCRVVAATLGAFATSSPELFVAVSAAFADREANLEFVFDETMMT
jgi:Ca2+/Na+ antiporter